jgi:hypothetical protein
MRRKGVPLKDHHKDNLRNIRATERNAQQRRAESAAGKAVEERRPSTARRYQGIQSKISEDMARPSTAPSSRNYLRAGQKSRVQSFQSPKEKPYVPRAKRRPPIPQPTRVPAAPYDDKDFIAINCELVEKIDHEQQHKKHLVEEERQQEPLMRAVNGPDFGHVPAYLQHRRSEMKAVQVAKAESEEAARHPGFEMLKPEERLWMLQDMQERYASQTARLQALPIATDTFRIRQLKGALEKELADLEHDIHRFSHKTVLVKRST